MNIKDNQNIKVLNYSTSCQAVKTANREYKFEGSVNNVPSVFYMNFRDIEYINSRSNVIMTGGLVFDPSEQDEIYNALNLPNWKETVLFEDTIEDMILNPTIEKMQRILSIRDIATFERIRGKLVSFINQGNVDISNRVQDLIKERFRELNCGITNSKIILQKNEKLVSNTNEISELKAQLQKMQEMMAQMMSTQNSSEEKTSDEDQAKTTKTVGRPPKKA